MVLLLLIKDQTKLCQMWWIAWGPNCQVPPPTYGYPHALIIMQDSDIWLYFENEDVFLNFGVADFGEIPHGSNVLTKRCSKRMAYVSFNWEKEGMGVMAPLWQIRRSLQRNHKRKGDRLMTSTHVAVRRIYKISAWKIGRLQRTECTVPKETSRHVYFVSNFLAD